MDTNRRLLHYAMMRLARDFDTRFTLLLKTGRLAKWYSQIGTEATSVAAGLALEAGDVLCTLHRDLGAILATYLDPARAFPGLGFGEPDGLRPEPGELLHRLACQLLGRGEGFSRGIERSFHYACVDPDRGVRHVGMISHLGAMIPVAAGTAFALRQAGEGRLAVNFIGDGGTSTGDFHEGLNMAAVWKLPLILVIENNRYAFSTPLSAQHAAERLSDRGAGYGIAAETVDGNDPERMAAAMARAAARARAGEGPTLIEAMLGRMRGHSEGDDSLKVVPEDELEGYLAADPVPAYEARLDGEKAWSEETKERLLERISELVEGAVESALAAPEPDVELAHRSVFAEEIPPSPPFSKGGEEVVSRPPSGFPPSEEGGGEVVSRPPSGFPPSEEGGPPSGFPPSEEGGPPSGFPPLEKGGQGGFVSAASPPEVHSARGDADGPDQTFVEGIHQALRDEMERDDTVVLMGQDIGRFEGAFRITKGLWQRWPERVLDTPIAESGTLGIAAGAAIFGWRPVVEMQFGDFITCGFNQLVNVIAKMYYRWEIPCPLVVRLPTGGGVGAGPFHSQNPEAWFAHTAGLKVVCPATAPDAKLLLKAAIRDPNPVIFCEHKFLYRRIKAPLPGPEAVGELGRAVVRRSGGDLTFVGYGVSTWWALEAAEVLSKEGIEAEVVDLRTLVPLDEETVLGSVRRTGRVIVAHEAQETGGFGGELAARIADRAFAWLDAPIRRVAYPDRPVPFSRKLEQSLLPEPESLVETARELLAW